MPRVSIIISVYNGVDYLPRCTQSVLDQTMPDWECLLVDDGSPDGVTPDLCDEIASGDPRFAAYHKENGGADSGWRYGIERAKGDWIVFLDQDDLLAPYALETALRVGEEHPDSMVLWHWSNRQEDLILPEGETPVRRRTIDESARMFTESLMYYAWGRLFSRKILCKYGVRPPEGIVYGGDLIFCMEYIRACLAEGYKDYAVIQCPLYFYELGNSQSVTTRLRPTYCDDELVTTAYLLQGFAPPLTVPDEDFGRVLHNCMRTMAEGYAYVLYHEQGLNSAQRHAKIRRYLAHPAMLALLQAFGERKLYSPYYFWLRRGWYRPACFIARLKAESSRWYHRVYWAGWWLHTALHGKKEEIYL